MSFANTYEQLISDIDYDFIIDFVEKHLSKDKTLLDVGCGTGVFSLALKQRGYDVTAIDKDAEMLSVMGQKAHDAGLAIETYIHDIKKPLNATYDQMILLNDVINYFKGIKTVAKHLYLGLNDGGTIVLDIYKEEYLTVMDGYIEIDSSPILYEWRVNVTNNRMEHQIIANNETFKFSQYIHDLSYYIETFKLAKFKVTELEGPDERKYYLQLKK